MIMIMIMNKKKNRISLHLKRNQFHTLDTSNHQNRHTLKLEMVPHKMDTFFFSKSNLSSFLYVKYNENI